MRRLLGSIVLLTACAQGWAAEPTKPEDTSIRTARKLFESFVQLEHAFDPKVADLYSDEALIRNKRTYPTGQVRETSIPAPQYKDLLRKSMPLAKTRGDISTYSQVTYAIEGGGVRIKADRFSELKKYHSPISMLVKPSADGALLIVEEISESQP